MPSLSYASNLFYSDLPRKGRDRRKIDGYHAHAANRADLFN